ncbi:alpha/beta fold hydrolase [Microcella sp.]|uniref:alpha/beta fold hydrolase n=1 Tax=Microcella sp. TaxID=1913979 RepID=UPI002606B0FC|nr:alpha/beta hydrolase [Microcella sp.]
MIELEPPVVSVPVEGGDLAVGVYNGADDAAVHSGAAPVLAVHGITANHRCWPLVAAALPHVRLIAPDLRGRGRSSSVAGAAGLRQHAADLIAVLDALEVPAAHLVAHSMGAFVSVVTAALHPDRVLTLTLVDGGLPLQRPASVSPTASGTELLGPAGERLSMTFASREEYRQFWHRHPAFAEQWSPVVQGYVDYDLEGVEPALRPSAVLQAVSADVVELYGPDWYLEALRAVRAPASFLRAPRGLLNEPTALYAPGHADDQRALTPLRVVEIDDVNHYTIVLAQHGAAAVAEEVGRAIASTAEVSSH